jgi:hypothetical protein
MGVPLSIIDLSSAAFIDFYSAAFSMVSHLQLWLGSMWHSSCDEDVYNNQG